MEPIDRVHACFYAFVLAAAALQLGSLVEPWKPLLWYGGALVATVVVARALVGATGMRSTLPRVVFAFAVAPFSFLMLATVVPPHPFHGERLLHAIDTAICFGCNPNEALDRIATPLLTELLQLVYAFYYLIPILLLCAFLVEKKPGALSRGLFAVMLCLYLSYVGYFILPATGPNLNALGLYPPHFCDPMPGVWIAEKLRATTLAMEWIKHDCWPSGHTALALTCLVTAKRERSKAFVILLLPVVLLVFSTMYLRYHYVTDVIFGFALAWLTLRIAPPLHARFYGPGSPQLEA